MYILSVSGSAIGRFYVFHVYRPVIFYHLEIMLRKRKTYGKGIIWKLSKQQKTIYEKELFGCYKITKMYHPIDNKMHKCYCNKFCCQHLCTSLCCVSLILNMYLSQLNWKNIGVKRKIAINPKHILTSYNISFIRPNNDQRYLMKTL